MDSIDASEPVLMNDFGRQWRDTSQCVLDAVREVGESGWYILGKQVEAFEAQLAAELGHGYAVGCASGLDAIEIALRALGLKAGQKVLTTPTSAFATTLAIVRAGGVPVFVDVDATGLIDLELSRQRLAADRSIRFMVPVHLFGHALDLDELAALGCDFDVAIVEDCAQAVGAGWAGRPVASVGRLNALSFYPTKNLGALGDGGALLTGDMGARDAARQLRDYGQSARYVHSVIGLNSRLDEVHAAILSRAFLPRLSEWTVRRRAIATHYLQEIDHPRVRPLPKPARSDSVWHLFPVTVDSAERDVFRSHLSARGVQSNLHYPYLIPSQAALRDVPFEVAGELRRAEALARSEVSLPIHPYLSDQEVARVIAAVRGFAAL